MSRRFGVGRGSREYSEKPRRVRGWLLVALLAGAAGCLGESTPFCWNWLSGPETEREDLSAMRFVTGSRVLEDPGPRT